MNHDLKKTGARSIILGKNHYEGFINFKENKLLKLTKTCILHDEFKYLDEIRKIKNYSNYYTIPDKTVKLLEPSDKFFNHVMDLVKDDDMNIFNGPIMYMYIDDAGDRDLLETITDIIDSNNFSVWTSLKVIHNFTNKMLEALNFLHQKKLCHLDIKPENIMINTLKKTYKIIDFGFCSKEPFNEFILEMKGTPGYFPKYFPNEKETEWLPIIRANDFIPLNGEIPIKTNRKLVYKIDSFCLGRVLYFLKYIYQENVIYFCFNNERGTSRNLDEIISSLVENNIFKRLTIEQCLNKYFK
jgi:serine/threonine protein kinase